MFIDNYLNNLQEKELDEGKADVIAKSGKAALQKAGDILGVRQAAIAAKRHAIAKQQLAKTKGIKKVVAMKRAELGAQAMKRKAMAKAALRTGGAAGAVGGAGYAATRREAEELDEGKADVIAKSGKAVLQKAGDVLGVRQAALAIKRKKILALAAKKRGQSSIAAMKGAKQLQRKAMTKAALRTGGAAGAVGAAGYAATRREAKELIEEGQSILEKIGALTKLAKLAKDPFKKKEYLKALKNQKARAAEYKSKVKDIKSRTPDADYRGYRRRSYKQTRQYLGKPSAAQARLLKSAEITKKRAKIMKRRKIAAGATAVGGAAAVGAAYQKTS